MLISEAYDYPPKRNFAGVAFVKFIEACGDIMKDIGALIEDAGAAYERKIIGGFGSIQLFIIRKGYCRKAIVFNNRTTV